jgi:hypothetical protein
MGAPAVTALDSIVNGPEQLLERIGKAFVVAAGVVGVGADGWLQQGGIAEEQFVW